MSAVSVRLEQDLATELKNLAKETGRSQSYYLKLALAEFLEDRADYFLALAVLERKEPRVSLADVRKELGLER
jgi:RHH-type rel operon transcriptional repressor/antitoxin RelB